MNDNKELFKKLKESLENSVKKFLKFAASDMTQLTTTDGDTLSIDAPDLTIGASVYTTDENGNLTPADDGDYTFEDGRIITIADGKISTISGTPVSADATVSPDTDMKQELATDGLPDAVSENPIGAAPTDDNSDLESRVSALESQMQDVLALLQASSTASEQLMSRVEKLSKEPATESIKTVKNFSSVGDTKTIADYKKLFRD